MLDFVIVWNVIFIELCVVILILVLGGIVFNVKLIKRIIQNANPF